MEGVLAGIRRREVGGRSGVEGGGGRVVEDFVEAADLGDEGASEGSGWVEGVAVEDGAGVDFVGGQVGEEGVVEHQLHERWAEGGAFGDGVGAARFDVCDVDF